VEIRKLLVANRGEIAVRIFRTCRRLGIGTVAVASSSDRSAFHVREAGEAYPIVGDYHWDGGAEVIEAARKAGADAVHPGYGFLAESPEFAAAVEAAGLVWIGPPADVVRLAGDKIEAKRTAREAGVPVVPDGSPEELGFPLLVKAAAGGGGRGMRIVRAPNELEDALAAARREAAAAFGDDRVFCERYLERPRHVEVQLLADRHGVVAHLGERDCSVQRRHQKVLEETPSPVVDEGLRSELGDAAVAVAQAVSYVGAGTAEFVLADGDFFFLELNARIQVEHPVTELVTGIDLVEQQLRIAAGERLDVEAVETSGHAVEARLYAEDPRTFLPQAGRVERLRLPDEIRVDAGVEAGDEVPVDYDPLIAKLVAHGESRDEALDELERALDETEVGGVATNLPFLRWLVRHPVVRAGEATTAFLDEHPPLSRPPRVAAPWLGHWRLNSRAPAPPRRPPPTVEASAHAASGAHAEESAVTAPMPGVVLKVLVSPGDRVEPRQPLVVLEAMKMETPLVSPYEAVVRSVNVGEGDRVPGGAVLVELAE
jgi:acetyl-CoA/propionyl-CoA carboxylase, biotin carboxylase, biotin carboxyl carrier protein